MKSESDAEKYITFISEEEYSSIHVYTLPVTSVPCKFPNPLFPSCTTGKLPADVVRKCPCNSEFYCYSM